MPLLEVHGLHRSFYGVRALDGVDLAVEPGTITGLIGPNGAGKTTLFNCVSGLIPPERGRVVFDGSDITGWRPDRVTAGGLVRTFQIARGFPRLSVLENLHALRRAPAGRAALARRCGAPAACGGARTELRARALAVARRLNLDARGRQSRLRSLRRPEEAARDRPRADDRAQADPARRAGRRRQSRRWPARSASTCRRCAPTASPS